MNEVKHFKNINRIGKVRGMKEYHDTVNKLTFKHKLYTLAERVEAKGSMARILKKKKK